MRQWEYRCVVANHTWTENIEIGGERAQIVYQIEAIMNALGEEGWELVGVRPYERMNDEYKPSAVLFFKRPVS
jgi:hypothetical protein